MRIIDSVLMSHRYTPSHAQVLCKALDTRTTELMRALQSASSALPASRSSHSSAAAVAEVRAVPSASLASEAFTRALTAVTDLCSRTSAKFGGDTKSQQLWFAVLDWIVAQQEGATSRPSGDAEQPGPPIVDVHGDGVAAAALRAVLSETLQAVMEVMRRSVPLNVVLQKVLSDHSQSPFGEFRGVILTMLGSHAHDSRILATAGAMMKQDVFSSVHRLHSGFAAAINASGGTGEETRYGVRGAADSGARSAVAFCAACGGQLLLGSGMGGASVGGAQRVASRAGASGVAPDGGGGGAQLQAVFGCGHSYHLNCLPQAGGGGARAVCPQCSKVGREDAGPDTAAPQTLRGGRPRGSTFAAGAGSGGAASLDVQKLRPMQAAAEGEDSDDDDDLAARERALNMGRQGVDNGLRPLGGAATSAAVSGGAPTANGGPPSDESVDPHVVRLRQARSARACHRPLAELYADLRRPAGALQASAAFEQMCVVRLRNPSLPRYYLTQVTVASSLNLKPARVTSRVPMKLVLMPGSWAASGQRKEVPHGEFAEGDAPL